MGQTKIEVAIVKLTAEAQIASVFSYSACCKLFEVPRRCLIGLIRSAASLTAGAVRPHAAYAPCFNYASVGAAVATSRASLIVETRSRAAGEITPATSVGRETTRVQRSKLIEVWPLSLSCRLACDPRQLICTDVSAADRTLKKLFYVTDTFASD